MSRTSTFEGRLAALEQQVAELRNAWANGSVQKDWRSTIGMFTDDEIVREMFAEALRFREADRRRARRLSRKKRQPKS